MTEEKDIKMKEGNANTQMPENTSGQSAGDIQSDQDANNISSEITEGSVEKEKTHQKDKKRQFSRKKKFSSRKREDRKPEFEQKIISMRRVTRVMAGGRRFSFSVAMVLGDKNGRVGVGLGKSNDTSLAIEKAMRDAKANMITVKRTEENSIPFNVRYKFGSSEVEVRPAPGRGLVAGASVRTVLDMAGITDVTSKIWTRSKNQINIARATIEALKNLND